MRDLPFFKNYEKFVNHRNLVHTSDNPDIDPEVQMLTEQLMEDVIRQLDDLLKEVVNPAIPTLFFGILP